MNSCRFLVVIWRRVAQSGSSEFPNSNFCALEMLDETKFEFLLDDRIGVVDGKGESGAGGWCGE